MAKLKCKKCGNENFESKSDDTYYLEIEEDFESGMAIATVVDQDVLGDVTAQTITCSKCGEVFSWEDGVEWNWDDSPLYSLQQQDLPH